jgi:AraC-like DNA-binding protein
MDKMILNGYALMLWMTLFQAILFSILLLVRSYRQSKHSDLLLALLILILGLSTIPHLFGWLGIAVLWNDWTFYPWNGLELAVLPTAFLFLQSRLNTQWRVSLKDLRLYCLYIVYVFYHLAVAVQGKEFAKWWWFEINNRYNIDAIFSFCNVVLFAFHIRRFFKTYNAYQHWSANRYSNLPLLSISWIRSFLIAYFIFIAIDVGLTVMELSIGAQYDKMWWAYLGNLALTYHISLYGFYEKPPAEVFFEMPRAENESEKATDKPLFSPAEISDWRDKISRYLNSEQPYLNPELRLNELAQHFNINISLLSTLINLCFEQNFNDLINTYRIEAFVQKIETGALTQFTLLSIAFDCGFNSKTTFNRVFKKQLGLTPSDFLKKRPVKSAE